jgi:hypothetical protein
MRPPVILGHYRRADGPSGMTMGKLKQTKSWSLVRVLVRLVTVTSFVIMLPFRMVFQLIAWLGRVTALLLGFCLMVMGMAFLAGPFFWFGIPLFVVGLVLTLRCLD